MVSRMLSGMNRSIDDHILLYRDEYDELLEKVEDHLHLVSVKFWEQFDCFVAPTSPIPLSCRLHRDAPFRVRENVSQT